MDQVDLQDCVYMDESNRAYVAGKKKKPFSENEILDNIQQQVKRYPIAPTGCMGCASVLSLLMSLCFMIIGAFLTIYLVYSLIVNITVGRFRFDDLIITLGIGISGGIVFTLGIKNFLMNYHALRAPHPSEVYSRDLARKYYEQLVAQREIIEGQITDVRSTEENSRQIVYRFETSDKHTIEGIYLTSSNKDVTLGGKVAVLYMNNVINVLL